MTRPDEGVRHGGDGGFTLLELLVAITVFALMAGILVAGFRFGVRVWEQAETASMQLTDVESAYAIVRRLIANAQPLTVASEDGNVHVDFAGTASRLSFVAPPRCRRSSAPCTPSRWCASRPGPPSRENSWC